MSDPIPPGLLALTQTATSTLVLSSPSAVLATVTTALSDIAKATPTSTPSAGKCELLGPFAIIVQAALGGLALLSLVYKRWRERPQRPVKIWAFDVSKQVVGSILLHMANLLLSMISSGDLESGRSKGSDLNPCSFYLLNLGIDTTLGIPILILFLKVLTALALKTPFGEPPESIQTGHYGNPPKVSWWMKQSFLYFLGLLSMKIVVAILFQILPMIVYVGDWALKWTEGNEQLQIFFVMLFFPLVMNACQYYIIDGFIKGKKDEDVESISSEPDNAADRRHSGDEDDDETRALAWDVDYDEDEEEGLKKTARAKLAKSAEGKGIKSPTTVKIQQEEYDPENDGERSNSSSERNGLGPR